VSEAYYRLVDDKRIRGRWYLKGPVGPDGRQVDPRIFLDGQSLEVPGPLTVPLRRNGAPLDFTLADFDMPVLRAEYGEALAKLAPREVQLVPARIQGADGQFVVLNATSALTCLDEGRSEVSFWTAEDGEPEQVGRYRMVASPQVDLARTNGQHVFRIAGWEVALIVSEDARTLLRDARGAVFEPA
jgi:hypothetical protein